MSMTLSKNFVSILSSLFDDNYIVHLIDILGEVVSDRKGRCIKTAINYLKYVMIHADEFEDSHLNELFYQTYFYVCTLVDVVPIPPHEDA